MGKLALGRVPIQRSVVLAIAPRKQIYLDALVIKP